MYGLDSKETCLEQIKEAKNMLDNIESCDYMDLESISSRMAHVYMLSNIDDNINKYAFMLLERAQKEKIKYIINHPKENIEYI